ncbi:MlaD family protein [Flavisphingomonas formosensis]|uniref:MlaD family protein n=1 Tax=Flavisphingomonas formosensis TaxID=861534 RepID=UPI0012F7AED8|nr:MlaD family protein [Sphingomonas formosensis]
METRSNHVLVGGVVLGLLVLTLATIIWIMHIGNPDRKQFDIFFKQSVDGLAKGSQVTFSGVPTGKVEEIKLMPDSPEFVRVRISVDEGVPVLQGTTASIAGVGFTGVSQINLDGAIKGAPPISEPGPYGKPVIPTRQGGLGALLSTAPQLLERLTTLTERMTSLLSDQNQKSITGILANVDKLSGDLAARGPEIAATLAQTRIAVQQAGDAAQKIGALADTTNAAMQSDVKPMLANLNQTVAAAKHTLESIDSTVSEAKPGLRAFSAQTIPEISQLVRDLTEMSEALTGVANRLDRGGAGAVLGGSKLPDYKPKGR